MGLGEQQGKRGEEKRRKVKRRRQKRKKAILENWRRFGWTSIQLPPGSALLELAYLAGNDDNS